MNTCNPRNWEVEARGAQVQGYPWTHRVFEASLRYVRYPELGGGGWKEGEEEGENVEEEDEKKKGRRGVEKRSLGFTSGMEKMPRALSMGCTVAMWQQVQTLCHIRRLVLGPSSHSHPRHLPGKDGHCALLA